MTNTQQPQALAIDTMERRRGDWMQTVTGRQFWPMDPRASEVFPEDIAHSLAHQCRYAGHCRAFYSVAQHSVLVSLAVPPEDALWGLLHDASEAYLVDVPRPVKPFLAGYKAAERAVTVAIASRFGLPLEMPASVKVADERILADEAAQLMTAPPVPWNLRYSAFGITINPLPPAQAKALFLSRLSELLPGEAQLPVLPSASATSGEQRAPSIAARMLTVLDAYEAWEADIILNADWSGGTPRPDQEQWDRFIEIQGMRNAAMKEAGAAGLRAFQVTPNDGGPQG